LNHANVEYRSVVGEMQWGAQQQSQAEKLKCAAGTFQPRMN